MAKVAICAGHGGSGSTPGKRSPDNEYEWDFNNKVVCAAEHMLKENGVEVLRTDDASGKTDVPLRARTDRANAWGADVYVSVHHNAFNSRWGDHGGVETFTQTGSYPNAERLAREVHTRIVRAMDLRDRGLKKSNLHITRETRMPAILTEGGFMDSALDIRALRDDAKLKAQGEAIAEGILAYFGKPSTRPNKSNPQRVKKGGASSNSIGKVTVKASSLWTYDRPDWGARHQTVSRGEVFTVTRELTVNGSKMYQLRSGLYITANTQYVDFSRAGGGTTTQATSTARTARATKEYVQLPSNAKTWRTYRLSVAPIAKNSDWSLTPSRFGGLTYEVLARPQKDVVTINTSRGRRNIYVAPSTGARITRK
ncbi:N-acetylmuramoyl-L-alanine amidase [Bacillus sp. FSL W7-1360]